MQAKLPGANPCLPPLSEVCSNGGHKCPAIPKRWADGITPCLSFGRSLHGRIGAKHAPTQGCFCFVYVALVHRPSSPPVAGRFAAIVVTLHESGGKPRGEAQGCTVISVGRKAADGVPGCPRPHTLATPRYSALYRHDSRTIKCPPLLAGGGHFGGRGNRLPQSAFTDGNSGCWFHTDVSGM
jgi:hypothetical protein